MQRRNQCALRARKEGFQRQGRGDVGENGRRQDKSKRKTVFDVKYFTMIFESYSKY